MELLVNNSIVNNTSIVEKNVLQSKVNRLFDKWTLWAHYPHDTSWSIESYKKLYTFDSIESIVAFYKILPENIIKNCMLFLMRDGIIPTWEDNKNKDGGCFSYKINNKFVGNIWKRLSYNLVGENLTDNKKLLPNINGITISPKINFCIIKIWISCCEFQSANLIKDINELTSSGCIFKKHLQN